MIHNIFHKKTMALAILTGTISLTAPGTLLQSVQAAELEEIIVSARKRDETALEVPVAITALSAATMQRQGLNTIDSIAQRVPSLLIGEESGSVQGGGITLRGIGSAGSNPQGDAAVSFNIDGVQVSKSSVRRMGQFDLQQLEVLRGPQALFFGKNSPGGIISMRTANPTDEFAAKIQAGYEFEAGEIRTEGYISGPLTDTIGFRLAGYTSDMDGWLDSKIPDNSPYGFSGPDAPQQEDYGIRGTLRFEPNDAFDATLKLSYGELKGPGINQTVQVVDCPLGVSQIEAAVGLTPATRVDDCKPGDYTSTADWGPFLTSDIIDNELIAAGKAKNDQDQMLFGLEMNYDLTEELTLTSVTGYYDSSLENVANFTNSWTTLLLPSNNWLEVEDLTQEFRIASDYEGPFNFQAGAFFQKATSRTGSHTFLIFAPDAGIEVNEYDTEVDTDAWSLFFQGRYAFSDTVELALGGRYSEEKKSLTDVVVDNSDVTNGTFGTDPVAIPVSSDEVTFYDFSPEATLTWQPTENLNVYASYKQGFLSGGFNGNSGVANLNVSPIYVPQETEGYELGIKGEFLDGTLRAGIAVYDYEVTGLQVVVITNNTVQSLQNVGEMTTKGVEFDFEWLTPVEGLSVYGALNFNDAEYDDYQANCYTGQTTTSPVPCTIQTNRFTGETAFWQDLSGTDAVRAPEYAGNLGFNFETTLTDGLNLNFGMNALFSDGFLTAVSSRPTGNSEEYTLVSANVSLSSSDDRWEIALIGNNLTEEYYWTQSTDLPFTGSDAANRISDGTETLADTAAGVSRGREVLLRLTYNFGAY